MPQNTRGLTLIEVLIALAIMSIALTAIIKASTQTIHNTNYLQDKIIANWVGEKILNDVRLDMITLSRVKEKNLTEIAMLGRNWYWRVLQNDTANSHIKKINVEVFAHEEDADNEDMGPLSSLETFIYRTENKNAA